MCFVLPYWTQEVQLLWNALRSSVSEMGLTCGRGDKFGQNDQKLHENYKINILSENWSDIGTQANFGVVGEIGRSPTRGNTSTFVQCFSSEPLV